MQLVLTIIAVIVIFSVLVLIHEFGHFWAAKKAGVKVLEFGFGFPPRLFAKKKGETLYSINAIPIGGFVKLLGEDIRDPGALKNPRSFSRKTTWTRTKIIVAGVLMNFLLAYALLTTGFTFGIQPLITNEDDLFAHLETGVVESHPGLFVQSVKKGSIAELAGLKTGDEILKINRRAAALSDIKILEEAQTEKDVDLTLRRSGGLAEAHLTLPSKGKNFGLDLNTATLFPHPVIFEVAKESVFESAGLFKNDAILKINNKAVYTVSEALSALSFDENFDLEILRGQDVMPLKLNLQHVPRVLIYEVFKNSAAEKNGLQSGDVLISINDALVSTPEQVQSLIRAGNRQPMRYKVLRNNGEITVEAVADEKNLLGIALNKIAVPIGRELQMHQGSILTSLTKINNVRFPFHKALGEAWYETGRLTKLTAFAFVNTLKNIFTKFQVPEDIGGPVQIAYYTHTFVKEGFFALLRFTAILSLSLGVINILPIPALDGGRFLFVVIEVLFKKRVNARFEYLIHSIGFILLMLLILLVTFNDFAKIF